MSVALGCVVEGHGDVAAVPVLLRRLGEACRPPIAVDVRRPVRLPRSKAVRPGELERAVALAAHNAGVGGAVLVVLDADDECPKVLGPDLLRRARARICDVPLRVVLAKHEFEAWFLASLTELRGHRGIAADAASPQDPEGIRGAKELLSRCMAARPYRETLDQAPLAAALSLEAARRAPSFDKLMRDFEALCSEAARSRRNR